MKSIKSILTITVAVIIISTLMVGIGRSAEMNAFLGENVELKAETFLDFEPTSVYWLAYTGPEGFQNVNNTESFTTHLQIVDKIEPGSLLNYYNVLLKGWQGDVLVKTVIIQIYLEEKPWDIPVEEPMITSTTIEESIKDVIIDDSDKEKGNGKVRQFRYVRKVKQNHTNVIVRMRADTILPDLNGPVEVTITIKDQNGNIVVLSDDFETERKQAGKKKVAKTILQSEKVKNMNSAYTEF